MSATQNLAYSLTQVAHNLGALAAVGGSLAAVAAKDSHVKNKLTRLALAGWGTQGVSGAVFGATSYYFYHRLPDISGVAIDALIIKIACAILGFALLAACLAFWAHWRPETRTGMCTASAALSIIALCAAAFLRWFS